MFTYPREQWTTPRTHAPPSPAACEMSVVDGYDVHPTPAAGLARVVGKTALSVVGGSVPVSQKEFARRAYAFALDPQQNSGKQVQDSAASVKEMPPMLGIFNGALRNV